MTLEDDLLKLVPIGEENAVSARLIWEQLGLWSPSGIKYRLNELAAAGLIRRKKIDQAAGALYHYYKPA